MAGAHEAATSPRNRLPEPTEAQKAAGRYKTGTAHWQGLQIKVENPAYTERAGTGEDGKPWRNVMAAHYGFFPGTRGADGDEIDVFLGPVPDVPWAWVLNQNNADGTFDEHKVLAGFGSVESALSAYRHSYESGWDRFDPRPIRMSARQLRRWMRYGDTSRRITLSQVPPERITMDDTTQNKAPMVLWGADGLPINTTLSRLLYDLRALDAADGLLLDPLSMADVTEGAMVDTMDALVVEVGRLKPKVEAIRRLMENMGGDVKPLAVQFSDILRRNGGAHVAAIFELSDGQTITIWFHNPDATPAKLSIADVLVSWKWMLNKRDITLAVAPENGADLNPREVARRILALAGKNSAAFARANAKRAERMGNIEKLKGLLGDKQAELADLNAQIDEERPKAEARRAAAAQSQAKPAWRAEGFDPTSPEGFAVVYGDPAAQEYWQDRLDSFWQGRMVDVRNALRELGWDGERYKPLSKAGHTLKMVTKDVGGGRNIVSVNWEIEGVPGFFMSDDLSRTAEDIAKAINLGLLGYLGQQVAAEAGRGAAGVTDVDKLSDDELLAELGNPEPVSPAAAYAKAGRILGSGDYSSWEGDVIRAIEEREEVSASDAQAILEAQQVQGADLRAWHAEGLDPYDAAVRVLSAGFTYAPDEADSDPELAALARKFYPFASATDDFLTWAWEAHVDAIEDYDPLLTASKMDKVAGEYGATIEWALSDDVVGTIKVDGEIAGRIDMGADGNAMVYVGAEGDQRATYISQVDGQERPFMYSNDDAEEMVIGLMRMRSAANTTNEERILAGVAAGDFDGEPLPELLDRISEAFRGGKGVEGIAQLANAALDHWQALEAAAA